MKALKYFYVMVFSLVLLASCSKKSIDISKNDFPLDKKIVILPFYNLSETPYAGYKVASIIEGILRSKGVNVIKGYSSIENDLSKSKTFESNVFSSGLVLSGKVIEWKYKAGIDGEPAVSLYIEIKDKTGKIIWSSIASKTEWGHKSVSLIAQELIEDVFSKAMNSSPKKKKKNK